MQTLSTMQKELQSSWLPNFVEGARDFAPKSSTQHTTGVLVSKRSLQSQPECEKTRRAFVAFCVDRSVSEKIKVVLKLYKAINYKLCCTHSTSYSTTKEGMCVIQFGFGNYDFWWRIKDQGCEETVKLGTIVHFSANVIAECQKTKHLYDSYTYDKRVISVFQAGFHLGSLTCKVKLIGPTTRDPLLPWR